MNLSQTRQGQDWLSQFKTVDQEQAAIMLDRMMIVSTSELREWLGRVLLENSSRTSPLGLYVEREFTPGSRFFSTLKQGPAKRSIGDRGPAPIQPRRGSIHVGSEAIMAQLATELVRRDPRRFLISPGPDRLRPNKSRGGIRRLAILTDVIGSGDRICKMLDSLWNTETVRSWRSHRRVVFEILVVSYAASNAGYNRIRAHVLSPTIITAKITPAIDDFRSDEVLSASSMTILCERYDPRPHTESPGPLGHMASGTLLAFAHGCPNTTPRLFWRTGRHWRALFPNRSAVTMEMTFQQASIVNFAQRLNAVGHGALANNAVLAHFGDEAREALLLLAAISKGIRGNGHLASRTALLVPAISALLQAFEKAGWIDERGAITVQGLDELRAAKRVQPKPNVVPPDAISVYFPKSLRG